MDSSKKILKSVILIALGSSILAFGSYNFNYQNNITEGGVLGLLLLVKNVFNISPSITSLIIDLSLFALGAKFFGKKFLILSIFSTICFSSSYRVWESIGFLMPDLTSNMILASILAGIGVGIGAGLVLRAGAAGGGDDVIVLLGNKFTPLKINHIYMLTDAVILLLSLVYLDLRQVLFSILAVTISGNIINLIYQYKNENIKDENVGKEIPCKETLEKGASVTA